MPYYDHDNYSDRMARQIKEVVAESNRNAIVERLKKGRQERTLKGSPPGGTVPYGYRRKNQKWQIDPYESGIVKLIFELNKCEERPFKIANILNSQDLKRRNGKEWTGQQLIDILKREQLYRQGIFHYGEVKGQNKKLIILEDD